MPVWIWLKIIPEEPIGQIGMGLHFKSINYDAAVSSPKVLSINTLRCLVIRAQSQCRRTAGLVISGQLASTFLVTRLKPCWGRHLLTFSPSNVFYLISMIGLVHTVTFVGCWDNRLLICFFRWMMLTSALKFLYGNTHVKPTLTEKISFFRRLLRVAASRLPQEQVCCHWP